jgi:ParB family chromosome partitioning protein
MSDVRPRTIHLLPVDRIRVLNPRVRPRRAFDELVSSINRVGLKKPISVARRDCDGEVFYDLICGQGRLEAFKALAQSEIPGFVGDADEKECLLKSLIENCARRRHSALELFRDIKGMRTRGATPTEIAKKTGLNYHYVLDLLKLMSKGEERLLQAVEAGHIPITVAVEIADAKDFEVQQVLQQAYEQNLLRGKKLKTAKQLVERRLRRGKRFEVKGERKSVTPNTLIKDYHQNAERKRLLVRKATATRDRLTIVTEAMRALLSDENFVTLLRAESLDTFPKSLAARIKQDGA